MSIDDIKSPMPSVASNTDDSNGNYFPVNITGGNQGVAVRGDTEQSSEVGWIMIIFVTLWMFGVCLLLLACVPFFTKKISNRSYSEQADIKVDDEHQSIEDQREESLSHHESQSPEHKDTVVLSSGPIMALLIAFCLSIATHFSCEYADFDEERTNDNVHSIGLWSVLWYDNQERTEQCLSFSRVEFSVDSPLIFARMFAVLASTLGSFAMLFMLYHLLGQEKDDTAKVASMNTFSLRGLLWSTALAQGLVQILVASDYCRDEDDDYFCTLETGGVCSWTAAIYWAIAAIGFMSLPK